MQLHSSRLFLYRHPNNMLGRCLQILFSEHCINIRKRLAAVEFLCDLAGDDLQTHHFLPQIRMMVVQMSQLGQLGIRAKPAATAVCKLVHRGKQPRLSEPHPVKRTVKKYKVFPVSSRALLAVFYAARQSACFSIGVSTPRLRWTRLVL